MTSAVTFSDGSFLEFAQGKFDNWCIYLTRPGKNRYAPRDAIYFAELFQYGNKHGAKRIYDDFISIYDLSDRELKDDVFNHIHDISQKFGEDSLEIEILYSILYMGMVAENNKKCTVLKKRVKRLGVHQMLVDGMPPQEAANFSRKDFWKKSPHKMAIWNAMGNNIPFWKVLDRECDLRGF